MLGHIAIAAMGGCFSQNPDTGAAEATYFPTEKVTIAGVASKRHGLGTGEATFDSFFTATRWWVKWKVAAYSFSDYNSLLSVRTYVGSAAYGCTIATHNQHLLVYSNSTAEYFVNGAEREYVSQKDKESSVIVVENENKRFENSITSAVSFANVAPAFSTGPAASPLVTQYWGDLLSNDAHNVHWRRLPMVCVEKVGTALFEVDGKELIEY